MQSKEGRNNAKSLFEIERIASDNHIRDMLDYIDPSHLKDMYEEQLGYLKNAKILDAYKWMGKYLIPLDGIEYHSSKKIHCKNCLTKEHKEGEITYSHQAVTPVYLHPPKYGNRVYYPLDGPGNLKLKNEGLGYREEPRIWWKI